MSYLVCVESCSNHVEGNVNSKRSRVIFPEAWLLCDCAADWVTECYFYIAPFPLDFPVCPPWPARGPVRIREVLSYHPPPLLLLWPVWGRAYMEMGASSVLTATTFET